MRTLLPLLLVACTSARPPEFHPFRACLVDKVRGTFRTGMVIARNDDDFSFQFRFDDSTQGDKGRMWISSEDTSHILRPCAAAGLSDMSAERSGLPPPQ